MEADERYAYFLKSGRNPTSLQVCSFTDGDTRDYEVSAPVVAGPFKVGNRVGVYSCDSIYLLRDTALEPFPFPQNFRAWTSASEIHDLQAPVGKLPFLQGGNSLYIPGIASGVSGFLVVSMQERAPTFVPLPIKGRTSYSQDSAGRLVLSKDGEVVVYEGSRTVVRKEDHELSGVGAALYDAPLMIGRAKSSGGRESLRFFLNGTQEDFALARLSGFVETIGLYCLGRSLVVTCLAGQGSLLIVVWDCA